MFIWQTCWNNEFYGADIKLVCGFVSERVIDPTSAELSPGGPLLRSPDVFSADISFIKVHTFSQSSTKTFFGRLTVLSQVKKGFLRFPLLVDWLWRLGVAEERPEAGEEPLGPGLSATLRALFLLSRTTSAGRLQLDQESSC